MRALTGQQFRIQRGSSSAVITELAASLRALRVDGVDVVPTYPEDSLPSWGSGIVLVPWPNRIRDGVWSWNGTEQRLDLTERSRNNASHGLLRNTGYHPVERNEDSVTLSATVFPQHGYPFLLHTTVRYALVDGGLDVTHEVRNDSAAAAPVAVGTHPFFRIGDVPTEELILTVNGSTWFEVDQRLLPVAERPVDDEHDLRAGRRIGDLGALDIAYGGIRTDDGVAASLRAPDGRTVSLIQDASFGYVQVFTTPAYLSEQGEILAVAMEPMTAPADAFNSGTSVRRLEPGETWTLGWGIRYSA